MVLHSGYLHTNHNIPPTKLYASPTDFKFRKCSFLLTLVIKIVYFIELNGCAQVFVQILFLLHTRLWVLCTVLSRAWRPWFNAARLDSSGVRSCPGMFSDGTTSSLATKSVFRPLLGSWIITVMYE